MKAKINSNLTMNEQINVLPSIGTSIYFSVIFSYGRIRQFIARIGNVPSGGSVKVTQLPENSHPAHEVTRKPIVGVPAGSRDNYLLSVTIDENGEVYITNYSGHEAIEAYIDILYLA